MSSHPRTAPRNESLEAMVVASHKLVEDVAKDKAMEVEVADAADKDEDEDMVEDATEMTWSIMV